MCTLSDKWFIIVPNISSPLSHPFDSLSFSYYFKMFTKIFLNLDIIKPNSFCIESVLVILFTNQIFRKNTHQLPTQCLISLLTRSSVSKRWNCALLVRNWIRYLVIYFFRPYTAYFSLYSLINMQIWQFENLNRETNAFFLQFRHYLSMPTNSKSAKR
jgi:hypothetical protein